MILCIFKIGNKYISLDFDSDFSYYHVLMNNIRLITYIFLIFMNYLPIFSKVNETSIKITPFLSDIAPLIDGVLDDAVWNKAYIFNNFKMIEPKTGIEPTEKTELKVIITRDAIYIGIKNYDSEPSKISINSLDYDIKSRSNDIIKILIDPFMDKRNAYVFFVNAGGAKTDGLAFGERFSTNWDGIWNAKSKIDKDGWNAEIKIPFKTLSFKKGLKFWGFNIQRYIPRKMEQIRMSGISKDSFFYDPGVAAILEVPDNIRQGKGITFKGYGSLNSIGSFDDDFDRENKLNGGFDIYKNFTPNLLGAFSYNTDFADTEVDTRRINTTRFPLFFPEKRSFFLEGSDIFSFGIGLKRNFVPFFSRKIGLYDEEPIPIAFGSKIIGKIGDTNIALLDVQTKSFGNQPSKNYFAGRVYQNIFSQSKVGVIFTSGNPEDDSTNQLYGIDFVYSTSTFKKNKNFKTGAWFTYNKNNIEDGKHYAYGFKVDYPNDLFDIQFTYLYFGDAFEPSLSFLSRSGVQNISTGISYQPRPGKGFIGKYIRQFFFEFYTNFHWKLNGALETMRIFTAPINFRTENGEHIEFNIMPNIDVLDESFEISDGIIIPQGRYNFLRYRFEYSTSSYKMIKFDFGYKFGDYYNGKLNQLELGLNFKLHGNINTALQAEFIRGEFPEGDFAENLYRLKLDFYLNPDLGLLNFIQYDDVSEELGINTRIVWRISPGNTLYLVYNKSWERRWNPISRFYPFSDKGTIKLQFSIRP